MDRERLPAVPAVRARAGRARRVQRQVHEQPDGAAGRRLHHSAGHVRTTYRNFFPPAARWAFSGFASPRTPETAQSTRGAVTLTIDVHLEPAHAADSLRSDAYRGLTANPKELPPKWFYDDRGSQLFDEITRLPEYYPTRTERSILAARRRDRARHCGRHARRARLRDLGEDAAAPRRAAIGRHAHPLRALRRERDDAARGGRRGRRRVPGSRCTRSPATSSVTSTACPAAGVASSRSSAARSATCSPSSAPRFLAEIAAGLGPDDAFLLGTDLVKDPARLVAAYDDAAGVTAEFNRNVLRVLNRELGADFDRPLRARRALRPRQRVDRDAPPLDRGAGRQRSRARPRRSLRSRRGDAHRGERQVPARPGRA